MKPYFHSAQHAELDEYNKLDEIIDEYMVSNDLDQLKLKIKVSWRCLLTLDAYQLFVLFFLSIRKIFPKVKTTKNLNVPYIINLYMLVSKIIKIL